MSVPDLHNLSPLHAVCQGTQLRLWSVVNDYTEKLAGGGRHKVFHWRSRDTAKAARDLLTDATGQPHSVVYGPDHRKHPNNKGRKVRR